MKKFFNPECSNEKEIRQAVIITECIVLLSLLVVIFFTDTKFLLNNIGFYIYELLQFIIFVVYLIRSIYLLKKWNKPYSKWPASIPINFGYVIFILEIIIFGLSHYQFKDIAVLLVYIYLILFEIQLLIFAIFFEYLGNYTKKYISNEIQDFYSKFSTSSIYFNCDEVINICQNNAKLDLFISNLTLDQRNGKNIVENLKILKQKDIDTYFDLKNAVEFRVNRADSAILGIFISILNIFLVPNLKDIWKGIITSISKEGNLNSLQGIMYGVGLGFILSTIFIFLEVIKEEREKSKFREVLMYFAESER